MQNPETARTLRPLPWPAVRQRSNVMRATGRDTAARYGDRDEDQDQDGEANGDGVRNRDGLHSHLSLRRGADSGDAIDTKGRAVSMIAGGVTTSTLRERVLTAWRALTPVQRRLLVFAAVIGATGLFHVGVWLAQGMPSLVGPVTWRKPIVFGLSIAIVCASLAWALGFLPESRRLTRSTWIFMALLTVELSLIDMQQWRGVGSHFNERTLFDNVVFQTMGLIIFSAAVIIALWTWQLVRLDTRRQGLASESTRRPRSRSTTGQFRAAPTAWADAVSHAPSTGQPVRVEQRDPGGTRHGTLARPEPDAPAIVRVSAVAIDRPDRLHAARAGMLLLTGGNMIGVALAVTGSNIMRQTGTPPASIGLFADLRLAHAVALHALQVLPIAAIALGMLTTDRLRALQLSRGVTAAYVGLLLFAFSRTLAGVPIAAVLAGAPLVAYTMSTRLTRAAAPR